MYIDFLLADMFIMARYWDSNLFHYSEVFFIERYVYIMVKPVGTWEEVHYREVFTVGGSSLSEVPSVFISVKFRYENPQTIICTHIRSYFPNVFLVSTNRRGA